jgi:hypothetical protein
MQGIFIKRYLLFRVGSVCRLKCSHLGGKPFADEEFEMKEQKWLRQQSKDFYAVGFDALVRRWDKCINVGGGYVEKYMSPPPKVRISHVLRLISICDLFTDSPSYVLNLKLPQR